MSDFLRRVVRLWQAKLKLAREHKQEEFQKDADECLRFYASRHDFLYDPAYWAQRVQHETTDGRMVDAQMALPSPTLKITVNKTAEFVQVFGPFLYYQNPVRNVTARKPPIPPPEVFGIDTSMPAPDPMSDPMTWTPEQQQFAQAMQEYQMLVTQDEMEFKKREHRAAQLKYLLDYTPVEFDLKSESRNAIDEALIKGRGVLWCEMWQPKSGGVKVPGSFYDSVDNLLIDPDCENLKDAQWCAKKCCEPWWVLEDKYTIPMGLPRGFLRKYADRESMSEQGATNADEMGQSHRRTGDTRDLITYYRVWSRCGIGGRFHEGLRDEMETLENFGPNIFLVIAEGVPFPLNFQPEMMDWLKNAEQAPAVGQALSWPIEFWRDDMNPWPFSELDFHWKPRSVWPVAHLTFAIGYQQFLDWAMSAMTSKIVRSCRDIIAYDESIGTELLTALQGGGDFCLAAIKKRGPQFEDLIKQIQHMPMNTDMWRVLEAVSSAFERATGLTELMSGSAPHAYRSAEEATLKGDFAKVRPDDMANKCGHWMSLVSRKEGLAAQWLCKGQDLVKLLGQTGAMAWEKNVAGRPPDDIARELDFRIEAGSAKRPNVEADLQNTQEAAQFAGSMFMQAWQATGDPTPINTFLAWWAQPRQINPDLIKLPPLQLAPPMAGPPPKQEGPPQKAAA